MKVKNGFFFGLSLLLLLPLGYFIYDRIEFVRTARKTSAIVEQVTGRNDSCGRKRARYACTKFQATLRYEVRGNQYRITAPAGSTRGLDQPASRASYRIGGAEVVAYDPRKPSRGYRDMLWDIWGAPLVTFFVQFGTFVASFSDRRDHKRL